MLNCFGLQVRKEEHALQKPSGDPEGNYTSEKPDSLSKITELEANQMSSMSRLAVKADSKEKVGRIKCEKPLVNMPLEVQEDELREHKELIDFQGEGVRANNERILDNEIDDHLKDSLRAMKIVKPAPYTAFSTDDSLIKIENYDQKVMEGLLNGPLQENKVKQIHDLTVIDEQTRWKLYNYWRKKLSPSVEETCEECIIEFTECCEKLKETQKRSDKFVLETAEIIGMTTTVQE